jgi:protein-S-isoprenylcysteine O-methyltransferase Ste14
VAVLPAPVLPAAARWTILARVAELALWLWLVFGILAVVVRALLQKRRTGAFGISGVSGQPGSVEWLGGIGFVLAVALGVAAPVLAAADVVEPIDALDVTPVQVAGVVLYAVGLAGVMGAQRAMGASWRLGVAEEERTQLVTRGAFELVRNPIYTTMTATITGLALLVPSVVSLLAVVLLVASLELQTRVVEEPYLLRTHGDAYATYAGRVGRFVPGVGRLRAPQAASDTRRLDG